MEVIWDEFAAEFPDARQLAHVATRLVAAAILGVLVGWERKQLGKFAGTRTHMLVCVGTVLFVVVCLGSGMDSDGISRAIQGLTTGIGFVGGGAILKLVAEREA